MAEVLKTKNGYTVDGKKYDSFEDVRELFEPTPSPESEKPIMAKTVLVDKSTGRVILASAGTATVSDKLIAFSDNQFADGVDFDKVEIRTIKPTALLRGDICPKAVTVVSD